MKVILLLFCLFKSALLFSGFYSFNKHNNTTDANNFPLYKYNEFPLSSGARCLDGSKYGVHYAEGYGDGKNKILFSLKGGMWCLGRDKVSVISDCSDRSKTKFGSSDFWDKTDKNFNYGLMSGNVTANPIFYNWHRVLLYYCDGSGYQGGFNQPLEFNGTKLYFNGEKNALTAFEFGLSKIGVQNLDKLLITGCSAGGLASFYWGKYLNNYVKNLNSKAKVYGVADSGYFLDLENIISKDHDYFIKMKNMYELVNQEKPFVSRECLNDNKGSENLCFFADYLVKYIDFPFFILQSEYDAYQIHDFIGETCAGYVSMRNCTEAQMESISVYRANFLKTMERVLAEKPNFGIWSPSCLAHCWWWKPADIVNPNWVVSSLTITEALKNFLNSENDQRSNRLMDKDAWPSNDKCKDIPQINLSCN